MGGVAFNSVWWHAVNAQLTESPEAAAELRSLGRFWLPGPLLYAVAFAIAFVNVSLSLALYLLLILYFGVSGGWLSRRLAALRQPASPEPRGVSPRRK